MGGEAGFDDEAVEAAGAVLHAPKSGASLTLAPDSEDTSDNAALLAKALAAQDRSDAAAHTAQRYGIDLDEYDYED